MQHFQIILGRVDRINYSQPQSTLPHRLPTGSDQWRSKVDEAEPSLNCWNALVGIWMRYIDKVTSLYLGWSKVVGGGVGSERITARVWVLLSIPPSIRRIFDWLKVQELFSFSPLATRSDFASGSVISPVSSGPHQLAPRVRAHCRGRNRICRTSDVGQVAARGVRQLQKTKLVPRLCDASPR